MCLAQQVREGNCPACSPLPPPLTLACIRFINTSKDVEHVEGSYSACEHPTPLPRRPTKSYQAVRKIISSSTFFSDMILSGCLQQVQFKPD